MDLFDRGGCGKTGLAWPRRGVARTEDQTLRVLAQSADDALNAAGGFGCFVGGAGGAWQGTCVQGLGRLRQRSAALADLVERAALFSQLVANRAERGRRALRCEASLYGDFVDLYRSALQRTHRTGRFAYQGGNIGAFGAELGVRNGLQAGGQLTDLASAVACVMHRTDQHFLVFWGKQQIEPAGGFLDLYEQAGTLI